MEILKEIRNKLGFTQEEIAQTIGISRSFYALIENGKRKITPNIAYSIEQATNGEIKAEWLLLPQKYKEEIEEYLNKEPAGVGR